MSRVLFFARNCALVLISFAAFSSAAAAQGPSDTGLRNEIIEANELVFQGDYDGALGHFSAISQKYANSPAGDFYQAAALTWKSYVNAKLDEGSRAYDSTIESLLASSIKKAELVKARPDKSRNDESEALFYLGSAYAIRSRLNLYQNHAIAAARAARTAQQYFDQLIKLDPDYWDAYFASGSIFYRVGLLTGSSLGQLAANLLGPKALPVGDRERGLAYLKTASEKGALTGVDAKLALLEIYTFNENRFADALTLARALQAKYPGNQTFARYLLRAYLGLRDRAKLVQAARQIIAQVKAGRPGFGSFMRAEAERFITEAEKL